MADRDKAVTVPAGTFTTVSLDYIFTFYPFLAQGQPGRVIRQHFRYAKGVGMVMESIPGYYAAPVQEERRLLRYKVK